MDKLVQLWVCFVLVLSIPISILCSPLAIYAQLQSSTDSSTKVRDEDGNSLVSIKSSVTVGVSNETLNIKNGLLKNAVFSFLNSGPTILKTSASDQPIIKTKITNQINNDTQSVQGSEATNAIVVVEITKALTTVNASSYNLNQSGIITIDTSSSCKHSETKLISCDNTVIIK